jgi:hypothetical protein
MYYDIRTIHLAVNKIPDINVTSFFHSFNEGLVEKRGGQVFELAPGAKMSGNKQQITCQTRPWTGGSH